MKDEKNEKNEGRVLARITAEETLRDVTGGALSVVITGGGSDMTNVAGDNDGPLNQIP